VIAWAVLALLGLDRLIVHVHVVLDGRHVLMPQQFLQTKGIIAQHQVANSKGMAENVRADALLCDPSTFANACKEQRDAIDRKLATCLSQKEMIPPGAAPFC
jgi:hypothetical protein